MLVSISHNQQLVVSSGFNYYFKFYSKVNMNVTILTENSQDLDEAVSLLASEKTLALDCEGVDLGRGGEISIVQLSSRDRCFLFDVHGLKSTAALVIALKSILENPEIVKIIHDAKMDADALFYLLEIRLNRVHDTQACDKVIKHTEQNLNNTLLSYGCMPNTERNANIYKTNFRFWAIRPLTEKMIDWASGDVASLFELYKMQYEMASDVEKEMAHEASEESINFIRKCVMLSKQISPRMIGKFIGTSGSNIRSMMAQVPGSFFQLRGRRDSGTVYVYAPNEVALLKAEKLLNKYR